MVPLAGIDVTLSSKNLACMVFYDSAKFKGYCIDISTDATTVTLPTLAVLDFTAVDKATPMTIQCTRQTSTNESIICDVGLMSSKISELKVKIDATTGAITKDAQVDYSLYGDSSVISLRSSPNFIAANTVSFEDAFYKIQLFKRTSFSGNASAVQTFYSLDLPQLVDKARRDYSAVTYNLYMKTGETTTRLMVEDTWTTGVAKIYTLSEAFIEVGSVGYYDQLRLDTVNILVNNKMVTSASQPLLKAFWNPGSQSTSINDLTSESILTKYLWLWITIGSVILVIVIIVTCYYCRRDTIDKYKITL